MDWNVGIGHRLPLSMRVGFKVGFKNVCSLLFVSHCSGFQVVKCINMSILIL